MDVRVRLSWLSWVPAAVAMGALIVCAAHADDDDGWESVREEQGITVSTRKGAQAGIAHFRGRGVVEAPVLQVLSVILDGARSREWANGISQSEVVRKVDARTEIIHTVSPQPWPVRDRDLVMRRTVEVVQPAAEFRLRVVCVPDEAPVMEGTVRVQKCENGFALRKVDDGRTFVEFYVRADPGGGSPGWLTGFVARNIPLKTLLGLRKQVYKMRGHYREAIRSWAEAR